MPRFASRFMQRQRCSPRAEGLVYHHLFQLIRCCSTGYLLQACCGLCGRPYAFLRSSGWRFKVLYLQDFRPNPEGTYHPIWGVSTKDAAHYTALGELVSCGTLKSQDAAIGTGSTIYDEASKLYYTFYTGNKYKPTGDESAQVVMVATSADFKTWTKDRTF